MILLLKCQGCQKRKSIEVEDEAFDNWTKGTLVQKAFPELSVGDREMLISGLCSECFDELFPPDEAA